MNGKRRDPTKLSSAEKDALIRELRRQLAASQSEARLLRRRLGTAERERARADAFSADQDGAGLLEALRQAAPRRVWQPPTAIAVKLGRSFDLWRSPVVLSVLGLLLAAFAVDGAVGIWQARALRQQRQARLLLEHDALTSLFVELKQIVQEPDGLAPTPNHAPRYLRIVHPEHRGSTRRSDKGTPNCIH